MLVAVHAAAGAIIGKKIMYAPLAFLVGFIFHFVLDILPHGDEKLGRKFFGWRFNADEQVKEKIRGSVLYTAIDIFIMSMFLLYLFQTFEFANREAVIWAIFGSILPDFLVLIFIYKEYKFLKWAFNFHSKVHYIILNRIKSDMPLMHGTVYQLLLFIIFFWLIYIT